MRYPQSSETFKAERLSLNEYRIYAPSGCVQSEIQLHKRIFTADQAPLTPLLKSLRLTDAPSVTVDGQPYRFFKTLRSAKFFASHYDLGLQADQDEPAITARFGGKGWVTLIKHEGLEYTLKPTSVFGFAYELHRGAVEAARFKDVSPFFSVSSRRRYQLDAPAGPLPPLLLAFAFLLAVSSTYRMGL